MIKLLLFSFLSFSQQECDLAFPIKENNKNIEACIDIKKAYTIGHIKFFSFPRARKASDTWPYEYVYFASTASTRNRLCRLLGAKRESPNSHITDDTKNNLTYDKNGFTQKSDKKSLKVLGCRLI